MLGVIMLNIANNPHMLTAVMLNVIILNVMAPYIRCPLLLVLTAEFRLEWLGQ
jgi:hypothetical protein